MSFPLVIRDNVRRSVFFATEAISHFQFTYFLVFMECLTLISKNAKVFIQTIIQPGGTLIPEK